MSFFSKFDLGVWNIGIIENPVDDIFKDRNFEIRWMKHNYKDRFFADPFLMSVDSDYYTILAEELILWENHGRIVELIIEKWSMKLVKKTYLISEDWHLSYPIMFDNKIIPEAFRSGKLYSYELHKHSIIREMVLDQPLIDPTFLRYNGRIWIFGTTRERDIDAISALSIYYLDNNTFIPFIDNPIKTDIATARPGGNFFWYSNNLYRPVQDSTDLYGGKIHIMRVDNLDINVYEETKVKTVSSERSKKYNLGLHTFNVEDGFIVVDGFMYKRSLKKAIYLKASGIMKSISKENRNGSAIIQK